MRMPCSLAHGLICLNSSRCMMFSPIVFSGDTTRVGVLCTSTSSRTACFFTSWSVRYSPLLGRMAWTIAPLSSETPRPGSQRAGGGRVECGARLGLPLFRWFRRCHNCGRRGSRGVSQRQRSLGFRNRHCRRELWSLLH